MKKNALSHSSRNSRIQTFVFSVAARCAIRKMLTPSTCETEVFSKGIGPAYYKLGRKIVYHGADLNAWVEANRVDPGKA